MCNVALLLLMTQALAPRTVEFEYVASRPSQTVAVVGQFNQWDRAALRLQLQGDGKTWKGSAKIAPGVYQYLFCEDNSRWIPHPDKPKIQDGNGNTNNLLVVQPESYDAKPAVAGDNLLTEEAIEVRGTPVRLSRDRYRFWLRTRTGDLGKAEVVANGRRFPMSVGRQDELYQWWTGVVIHRGDAPLRAEILLEGGLRKLDAGTHQPATIPLPNVPGWVKDTIFYQIFPDRFENGSNANDPEGVRPWGTRPFGQREWMGGDLEGIRKRLNHLVQLQISGLYLNPIFEAISNHAYDTIDYMKVDPRFGTEADFRNLVKDARAQGIRVMLDAVYNHSSPRFFAFQDLLKNQEQSKYKDWYYVLRYPVSFGEGQTTYRTFAGVPSMPKLNTENPEVAAYLDKVSTYWIEQFGIAGWRLDVADEVSHEYWKGFRKAVKKADPDTYILGEVWGDAHPWLQGDQHDAVMNYRWRAALIEFLRNNGSGKKLEQDWKRIRDDYPDATLLGMFNLLGSHDTERILTVMRGDRNRARLAAVLQFTYPGVPSIYYGDEIGMEGGRDPDQRRTMIWDESRWDRPTYDLYRALTKLRKDSPALRRGVYRALETPERSQIVFERRLGSERIVVAVNNAEVPLTVPEGTLLLGRAREGALGWVVRPGDFAILAR